MRLLHTADWHLGRALYGKKRYEEYASFLDWLARTVEEEGVDVLLISGDIFDTTTPGNRSQELYYRFLCRVSSSCCRYVVVTAGNHDSPTLLDAPRELLRTMNIHVVGTPSDSFEEEVVVVRDSDGAPEGVICAVPYLRDRDIRTVEPGESQVDKERKLLEGIKNHYAGVCGAAERDRAKFEGEGYGRVPLIVMGHLFTSGGVTLADDGVRELYVGSLVQLGPDLFPPSVDYLALGHLHVPQCVGGNPYLRYSGSPIPVGFGESDQKKEVIVVEFKDGNRTIMPVTVPRFQQLERVSGTMNEILEKIEKLKKSEGGVWLEVEYTGGAVMGRLRETLEEALDGTAIEVLRIRNTRLAERVIESARESESLNDLNPTEVFSRCLESHGLPEEERPELNVSYNEVLASIEEEDHYG